MDAFDEYFARRLWGGLIDLGDLIIGYEVEVDFGAVFGQIVIENEGELIKRKDLEVLVWEKVDFGDEEALEQRNWVRNKIEGFIKPPIFELEGNIRIDLSEHGHKDGSFHMQMLRYGR